MNWDIIQYFFLKTSYCSGRNSGHFVVRKQQETTNKQYFVYRIRRTFRGEKKFNWNRTYHNLRNFWTKEVKCHLYNSIILIISPICKQCVFIQNASHPRHYHSQNLA